jgi:uncharacterized cupin superfamily protein
MTEAEVVLVQNAIEAMLNSRDGRAFDLGNPAHLKLLVQQARAQVPSTAEEELWITVVISWLGPQSAGPPPISVRQELQDLLRQMVPNERARQDRVMEFAIAYGCGKWREVQLGTGGWEHRWPGAMRGLVRALEPAVAQANRWLAEHVVGFPQDRSRSLTEGVAENTAVWSDAWMLASRLVHPEHQLSLLKNETLTLECTVEGTEVVTEKRDHETLIPPGAKAVWTILDHSSDLQLSSGESFSLPSGAVVFLLARDEDAILKTLVGEHSQQGRLQVGKEAVVPGPLVLALWECTCGTTHCVERHRLNSWNPVQVVQKTDMNEETGKKDATITLWDYVASAVKGPQASLKTGAFVQGCYFPLLAQEGLV